MAEILRRYTNLPSLLRLLRTKTITLLDPDSWDDSNDSHFLRLYQDKKSLETVLAICFTQTAETYHHWRVFAEGHSGICIQFDRAALLAAIGKRAGISHGDVRYLTLSQIRNKKLKIAELPFLKRAPYEDEREFRVIYESNQEGVRFLDLKIPLTCIRRVTLSPWIPLALSKDVKATLAAIKSCRKLEITRSTLIGNDEWKDLGEGAA